MFNKFFVRPWCGARICPTVNDPRRPTTATLLPFFSRFRPSILETRRRRRGGMRAEYRLSSSHPRPNTVVAYTPWLSWFSLSVYNNITRVDQMPKPPSPKPQRYFNFFFLPIKSLHREAKIRENTELFLIFIALRKFQRCILESCTNCYLCEKLFRFLERFDSFFRAGNGNIG